MFSGVAPSKKTSRRSLTKPGKGMVEITVKPSELERPANCPFLCNYSTAVGCIGVRREADSWQVTRAPQRRIQNILFLRKPPGSGRGSVLRWPRCVPIVLLKPTADFRIGFKAKNRTC
ncbi:unnamed protein product [Boreogadus saida]